MEIRAPGKRSQAVDWRCSCVSVQAAWESDYAVCVCVDQRENRTSRELAVSESLLAVPLVVLASSLCA